MKNIFISDLHLDETRPDMAEVFIRFLTKEVQPDDNLYILGDFFEIWIGDDDQTSFNQLIINTLKKAVASGMTIFIMHGNRDFLLGKTFFETTGCILLPDEYKITLQTQPTLLMHGDTLCTEDKPYLKFRKKARNKWLQKLFLWKSLKKRKAIADHYRQKSQAYTSTTPFHLMDVTQTEVEKKMREHQVNVLIHGHTHRQAIHTFELGQQKASRIVLGAWHDQGSAFICDELTGDRQFIEIK